MKKLYQTKTFYLFVFCFLFFTGKTSGKIIVKNVTGEAKIGFALRSIYQLELLIEQIKTESGMMMSYSYEETGSLNISDFTCNYTGANTTFTITDDFTVDDLNVGIVMSHTYREDLEVRLRAPSGTEAILWTRIGGDSDNFNVLIDSDAGTSISAVSGDHTTSAPFYSNTFTPEITTALDVFDGENAVGDWTLFVCDNAAGDNGNFFRGQLAFEGTAVGGTGGVIAGNLTCSAGATEITGVVFEDYDYDGQYDSGEHLGVEGIMITGTDSLGNSSNTTSGSDGTYTLGSLTAGRTYRIEFTNIPSWANPTFYGGDNGTLVQFVQPENCANLGLASSVDYCQTNPPIVVPCYVNGDPLLGGTAAAADWMVYFRNNNSGEIGSGGYTAPEEKITGEVIGATWGVTYHRQSGYALAGALMKRHSGLGVNGTGAIYKIDQTGTPSLFVDMNTYSNVNAGSDTRGTTNNILSGSAAIASRDINAFQAVGKVGFGDLDLSDDEQYLFAINLNDRTLIQMDVGRNLTVPASVDTFDIGGRIANLLSGNPIACGNASDYRPWGLKYYRGLLYIGVVCSAETSQTTSELHAYVLSFDPNNSGAGFSLVVDMDLNYVREAAFQSDNPAQTLSGAWRPWGTNWGHTISTPWRGVALPSPILSDIEFDASGSMILGFLDRFGMQAGYRQYSTNTSDPNADYQAIQAGDLIRFCNVSGVLTKENGTTCGFNTSPLWTNPPTDLIYEDEFYAEEEFFTTITNPSHGHPETGLGSLAFLPGSGEITAGVYDPFVLRSGGIAWFSNTDGSTNKEYELYESIDQGTPDGTFGKAAGLGDVEFICNPAPIEIGNYVWSDRDGDGIQDAGELGIEGVRVELYDNTGALLAFDTTNSLGLYAFSRSGLDDAIWQTANDTLIANTSYYIVVGGNGQFASGEMILSGTTYILTSDSLGSSTNRYEIDSDGEIAVNVDSDFDGEPYLEITTGNIGQVNHSFDFGFVPKCEFSITSAAAQNCTGSETYTAEWQVIFEYLNEPTGNITYQRNSEGINSFTPNTSPDTITISGIPADGGKSDTIRVYFANETICGDTLILIRPTPCPTPLTEGSGEVCAGLTANEIGGTVFEDWNYDGVMNQSDTIGVGGIKVYIYDCDGAVKDSTYTDINGNYKFSGLGTGALAEKPKEEYRVEFILPESVSCWAKPTQAGADNGTTVQFVEPGNCASLGLANPSDYCQTNPQLMTVCYVRGSVDGNNETALVSFINSSGSNSALDAGLYDSVTVHPVNVPASEIGATWGIAYDRNNEKIYTSAYMKPLMGLSPLSGESTGAIFTLDNTTNDGLGNTVTTASVFMDLNSAAYFNGATGTAPHTNATINATEYNAAAFAAAGKIGLGDLELSDDGETLFTINLNTRELYEIPIGAAGIAPSVGNIIVSPIPSTACSDTIRPFALAFYKEKLYIGAVCAAEISQNTNDLMAYIFEYTPGSGNILSTPVLEFPLDYERGILTGNGGTSLDADWNPWLNAWDDAKVNLVVANYDANLDLVGYPQPMLTDIEFDRGDMILGFVDRFSEQFYYGPNPGASSRTATSTPAGDMLRAGNNGDGTWTIEQNGSVTGVFTGMTTTGGAGNSQGPAALSGTTYTAPFGEYYFEEEYPVTSIVGWSAHDEVALGGLIQIPGFADVTTVVFDPAGALATEFGQGGIAWYNNQTGAWEKGYRLYYSGGDTFGKGNGFGDIEALCNPAPIEIGNYVWEDTNGDGIQDACEPGIENVRVELYNISGELIAFDTTDANGQYYFSHSDSTDQNWIAAMDSVEANTMYYISVGGGDFASDVLSVNGTKFELTVDSTNSGTNRYAIDSDGTIASSIDPDFDGKPYTKITTGNVGEVDHTFDFGFVPGYDYGDLPDIADGTTGITDYETYDSTGGPSHLIIAGLFLGDTVDIDNDGFPNASALGDDADNVDDEDGLIFFPSMNKRPGGTIRMPLSVTNTTGDTAYVEAWIDWNGDGDFDVVNELVADLKDNEDGVFPAYMEINIPSDVITGSQLGFRVRLSNSDNMTPYGRVNSGEVEDYLLDIQCPDKTCLPIQVAIEKK